MFYGIMLSTNKLNPGQSYTFTYDVGFVVGVIIGTEDYVLTHLRPVMADFADIIKVEHAFLSKKFAVTIVPKVTMSLEEWLNFFKYAWEQIGYVSTQFIQAESGAVTSAPGGIKGGAIDITKGVAEAAGESVTTALKGLAPVLIIGLIGIGALLYTQKKIVMR
jgi:hypothetical protein